MTAITKKPFAFIYNGNAKMNQANISWEARQVNTFPFGCGHSHMMQGGGAVSLCPALEQLRREHMPLRQQMEDFYKEAQGIGRDPQVDDWQGRIRELREKVARFASDLDPHSEKEENFLFPMMAKYIGREAGPIAVMEYEHEQAKKNLEMFLEKSERLSQPLGQQQATELAAYAVRAYNILADHFTKEEHVLFPMAEQILSQGEKEELAAKIGV
ncbi:hypothetical protein BSNK01_19710 [Bacillaceae bacterium]